jgi:hypothetical protein
MLRCLEDTYHDVVRVWKGWENIGWGIYRKGWDGIGQEE